MSCVRRLNLGGQEYKGRKYKVPNINWDAIDIQYFQKYIGFNPKDFINSWVSYLNEQKVKRQH